MAPGKEKMQLVDTSCAGSVLLATACATLTDDVAHLISIEDDDEDDAARKHISLTRYILAFCCAFLSDQPFHSGIGNRLLCKHPACNNAPKYIVQRTLRI